MVAKRFNILDGETNTPVIDFYNAVDTSVINKDRSNAKLSLSDIDNIKAAARGGDIPNTGKLNQLLNSGSSILAGADAATKNSLLDLTLVSPQYAKLIDGLGQGPGMSQLAGAIPKLLDQIVNSDVLSDAAAFARKHNPLSGAHIGSGHLPDFTGVFKDIPNIGTVLDKLKGYSHLPHLSTKTLNTIHRITNNPALKLLAVGALSTITIQQLTDLLFPQRTPTSTLVNTLPTTVRDKVLSEVGPVATQNPPTIPDVVGPPTPVTPGPELGRFIEAIHTLVPGAVPPPTPDPAVNAAIIVSIINTGTSLGINNLFDAISRTINDPIAIISAGSALAQIASTSGNLSALVNISQSPYASTIGASLPTLSNDILSNLTIPANATNHDLLQMATGLVLALDKLNPTWRSQSGPIVNGIVTYELSVANLSNLSPDVLRLLTTLAFNVSLSMPGVKGLTPTATTTAVANIPTTSTQDQWTYWASLYPVTTFKESLKMLFPDKIPFVA